MAASRNSPPTDLPARVGEYLAARLAPDEPRGGAHRDHVAMAQNLKKALQDALKQLSGMSTSELLAARYERLMSYGRFKEQPAK